MPTIGKPITIFVGLFLLMTYVSGNDEKGLILVETPEDVGSQDNDLVSTTVEQSSENFLDANAEPFIPTKEWQIVKEGQSVPAGLHIRMNFQTHLKEAKLMDGDDGARFQKKLKHNDQLSKEEKHIEAVDRATQRDGPKIVTGDKIKGTEEHPDPNKIYFTKQHLKDALKDFRDKFHHDDLQPDEQEISRAEAVKKKFRSIEEIRKELEDSHIMHTKSDAQIMKIKVEILKAENATEKEVLTALDDLEYYVHQIDNAVDLDKIHGMEVVIKYLNNSNVELQEQAAKVVGAAVQSNPKAQLAALEHGAMPFLLRIISYSSLERLRKTALFALSALIRTNSKAQIVFLKLDGLNHILKCLDADSSKSLKIKAVTLISDLIVEQEDAKKSLVKQGKMAENERTPLMIALVKQRWCELLRKQLSLKDHDSIEKVLAAINASTDACKRSFNKNDLRGTLYDIKSRYNNEIQQEDDEDVKSYLKTFPEQVDKILSKLGQLLTL
eukprot:Seg397.9 transcript_id=Seg397.9/GoldUCD/mRNA.D3Y31 product="Nucleotide exchange factor SIL1" protein_id=Seg397.9/GoldUCD/D3Y31